MSRLYWGTRPCDRYAVRTEGSLCSRVVDGAGLLQRCTGGTGPPPPGRRTRRGGKTRAQLELQPAGSSVLVPSSRFEGVRVHMRVCEQRVRMARNTTANRRETSARTQRLSSLYNQWFRFLFQKLCQLHPQAPNWGLSLSLLLKDRLCRGAAGGSGQEADM